MIGKLILLAVIIVCAAWIIVTAINLRRPAEPHRRSTWSPIFKQLLLAAPIRVWALILAGPALQAGLLATVWIAWRGGWAPTLQAQQLTVIGYAALGQGLLLAVVLIGLAAVKLDVETKLGRLSLDGDHGA